MAQAPLASDTCSVGGGGLAGRQAERSALCALLDAGAGMALVSGEAGIGKSALLAWLAGEARGRGWRVLRTGLAQGERGLSRIYHKLHVTSRTQLARHLPPDQPIATEGPVGERSGKGA